MLLTSSQPLAHVYDLAMLDLDGVVYVGPDAVQGAAEHVGRARDAGMRVAFITNNASRPPDAVAEHLTALGVKAAPDDVVTSAQAAARVLRDRFGAGARILCLGADGLRAALDEAGLVPLGVAGGEAGEDGGAGDDGADAVASGYGPDLRWGDLMRVAVRIRDGLPWVASNTDHTIPTPYGVAPGHGVLVDMLSRFTGVTPEVAGKPSRPLLDETIRRVGGSRPLMVGDRLDTDIEGARNAGIDSLLVLTGVTGLAELVAAGPALRPTYLSPDLAGLTTAHPAPAGDGERWVLGGWAGSVRDGRLQIEPTEPTEPDEADWWRVAAATAWHHLDTTGAVVDIAGLRVPGRERPAR
ncbi:HAD-IIA family hydrolase [Pimelobacter simplex]|uniref:HAD-IIA family hydrolase n=1 Tax=Nocardioides simplex TaxID=2045 RepID=UPI000535AC0B|nr:HAD-IIA family hydrolase [Pimelobacter simplex]SFM64125.1 Haloacid Dehalogenase Superfamily Class (subfamily) IIA [Pimelobacter simplex]